LHAVLVCAGEHGGQELLCKLMLEMNLVALQPKPYKRKPFPGEHERGSRDH
jgi:hypothetical protein